MENDERSQTITGGLERARKEGKQLGRRRKAWQNARSAVSQHNSPAAFLPHFRIILCWKPAHFHDHLVLDNSAVLSTGRDIVD
jgi:hypothetical protein